MEELVALSRSVAAELASAFRNDPGAELAAWFRIALEREGLVASLYSGQSIASRLQSFPKPLRRSAIAKVNGICANEETHVAMIRGLLAAECPWPEVALREIWGRLQGIVLNQLAGTNDVAWAVALLLLAVGARSERERAAARAVAGFDAAGFLRFTRTLEITAVESYQRIVTLMAALRRSPDASPYNFSAHVKLLGILRDERVHRDVLHVLYRSCGGRTPRRTPRIEETELPAGILRRRLTRPADLNAVCRAILIFHYGAALPSGASPQEARRAAVDYWRWQMDNSLRQSYFVECQGQDVFAPDGDILLVGTAGLDHVLIGASHFRRVDRHFLPGFLAHGESLLPRVAGAAAHRATERRGTLHSIGAAADRRKRQAHANRRMRTPAVTRQRRRKPLTLSAAPHV